MTPDEARARLARALGGAGQQSSDFDLDAGLVRPRMKELRPAGVLVGVETSGRVPEVILTRRAMHLRHHPGQIALPGGGRDAGDADDTATALREASEEIGLPADNVEILGALPPHETVTGFQVTPIVALIERPFPMILHQGEVDEAFRVPLAHLLDLRHYRIEGRAWGGQRRHYPVVPWGPYYIWGATARILRGLAERAG